MNHVEINSKKMEDFRQILFHFIQQATKEKSGVGTNYSLNCENITEL